MKSRLRIIVTGLIAQHPRLGGMTWHYLNYLLGLVKLGHDVYYLEDSGQWPYNLDGGASGNDWIAYDCAANLDYLGTTLARFGLADKWAYRFPIRSQWFGLSDSARREVLSTADLLINVSGSLELPHLYRKARRLAYIDTDPVFTQVKLDIADEGRGWDVSALDAVIGRLPRQHQGLEGDAWLPRLIEPGGPAAPGKSSFMDRFRSLRFRRRVQAHDVHFTFGERLAAGNATGGIRWIGTRQPVALSEWQQDQPFRDVFTTVMNWTSFKPLVWNGKTYGQKDAEFCRFLDLPRRTAPATMEVALSKKEHLNWRAAENCLPPELAGFARERQDWTASDLLEHAGWRVVDAMTVCSNLDRYRDYIQSSKAEWSVAKNGYVTGQAGWFSDRSACYLAAGKPVIVQATGFQDMLPCGEGILAFQDIREAIDAVGKVAGDYQRHSGAAKAIASAYFDSGAVLTRLLDGAFSSASPLAERQEA